MRKIAQNINWLKQLKFTHKENEPNRVIEEKKGQVILAVNFAQRNKYHALGFVQA